MADLIERLRWLAIQIQADADRAGWKQQSEGKVICDEAATALREKEERIRALEQDARRLDWLIENAEDLLPLLKEAHGVLDSVQWGFGHTRCPICTGWNVGPNGETDYAHTPTCPLALNLARLDATIRDMGVNHKTSL